MAYFAPIVEGHGEVEAVPALLHRITGTDRNSEILRVNPPIRVKAGSFLSDFDYFRRYVSLAGAKAAQEGGNVLILLDCEDACPETRGTDLLARARQVRSDVNIVVALAYREYETWFLTAARSLSGINGLPEDLDPPSDPDSIRDAKGWLSDRMNVPYDAPTHQLQFTRVFDLDTANRNHSFRRFRQRVLGLMGGAT